MNSPRTVSCIKITAAVMNLTKLYHDIWRPRGHRTLVRTLGLNKLNSFSQRNGAWPKMGKMHILFFIYFFAESWIELDFLPDSGEMEDQIWRDRAGARAILHPVKTCPDALVEELKEAEFFKHEDAEESELGPIAPIDVKLTHRYLATRKRNTREQ